MNSFGDRFRVTIFGESHGDTIGVVLDGVEAGIELCANDFMADIARRKSGAKGTTPRLESDLPEIVSGVYNGKTTGAPLAILFRNENTRSGDYSQLTASPRPSHADFVAGVKYNGFNDPRGGGHFSGRLTLCLVAAGVVAKRMLKEVEIEARITHIKGEVNSDKWSEIVEQALLQGDSVGGVVECVCRGVKAGLGDPFFESLEARIAQLVFAVPATKGVEFGDGFKCAQMWGSECNDPIVSASGKTSKNSSGGINGGISNGNPIIFRVAVKPTPSISKPQNSFNFERGDVEQLVIKGRHDDCIALRTPVIIEAIAAIALANS